jgi:hypothetical protein
VAKAYHKRLIELFRIEAEMLARGASDRDLNLILYLMRRAYRPLYQALRVQYIAVWGKRCSFSYFFPQHAHDDVWRSARALHRRLA